jgi:steroid 5-alpha reductase family enzyme
MSLVQLIAATAMIAVALSIAMTGAWLIQQRTGNSGWVDVTWTFGTGGVGALAALIPLSGSLPARQILVAVLVTLCSNAFHCLTPYHGWLSSSWWDGPADIWP